MERKEAESLHGSPVWWIQAVQSPHTTAKLGNTLATLKEEDGEKLAVTILTYF